jgi:hypothetical protein
MEWIVPVSVAAVIVGLGVYRYRKGRRIVG